MKFLVDNQLPIALSRHLDAIEHLSSIHVVDIGLDEASDREIWYYAKKYAYIIISKDVDFFQLASLDTEGPALVWVRLGNCRKGYLLDQFDQLLPELLDALKDQCKIIEVQ